MTVTSPGKEIIALPGMGTGHNTRTLAFNRDGSKLYLSVGSQSNIDLGEDPMRAAVHRFNPDGTGHETIATGLRNAVGMRFFLAPTICGCPCTSATSSATISRPTT